MNSKKLSIGSDHGGFTLKQELVKRLQADGFEVDDKGPANTDSVDYPDYALKVCEDVVNGKSDFGVLVCTTGIGMSMSANKFHGIRAAVCHMEDAAEFTRRHNDANVICFGEKYDTPYMAEKMVKIFAATDFEGGRHQRRIDKFMNLEGCQS